MSPFYNSTIIPDSYATLAPQNRRPAVAPISHIINQEHKTVNRLFHIKLVTELDGILGNIEYRINDLQIVVQVITDAASVERALVVLRDAEAAERVAGVIWVGVLARLVDHAPAVRIVIWRAQPLAAHDHVLLQGAHVEERPLEQELAAVSRVERLLDQGEERPNPVRVATVDELVRAALEAALGTHLAIHRPTQQSRQIDQVHAIQ